MRNQFLYTHLVNAVPTSRLIITHPKSTCEISLFGGQLLSFTPKGHHDLIWKSSQMNLTGSKPLRGGAPLCWPWFGPAATPDRSQHGYIRSMTWQVSELSETEDKVIVELCPPAAELALQGISASVKVRYDISDVITISLITYNLTGEAIPLTQAIHTYFAVDDIHQVSVHGLDDTLYLDQLTGKTERQRDAVFINGETDRIYQTENPVVMLCDASNQTELTSSGHDSIVVWNPWIDKAASMNDFDNDGYLTMICLETANTQKALLTPNSHKILTQTIRRLN